MAPPRSADDDEDDDSPLGGDEADLDQSAVADMDENEEEEGSDSAEEVC